LPFFRWVAEGHWVDLWVSIPDSRSGVIMGDFAVGGCSGHEGRGTGKSDPPWGHIIVNRKK
jgi:hypothetical protein